MMNMDDIRIMQHFLGENRRPITVYRESGDTLQIDYNSWLNEYYKELKEDCKRKLVEDYFKNIGSDLFKTKFQISKNSRGKFHVHA